MKRLPRVLSLLAGLAVLLGAPATAQYANLPQLAPEVVTRSSEVPVRAEDLPPLRRFVTEHETMIRGRALRYTATAGETYITNLAGEPTARIFSFAYVRDGGADPDRPVTFVFNGGPGSASLWLHMGALGPKRLVLDSEVNPSPTPPFGLVDNPFSPLDVTDLVFVDPVGTGFSQAVGNARNSDFFGVDEDADSMARFIEAWLTENGRWNAPKYLVGESYGSARAAVLPRPLMGGPLYTGVMRGITVDGIVLLGLVLDGPRPSDEERAAGPDPRLGLNLPAMAATAWYHERVDRAGRTVTQIHDEASAFAQGDYARALHRLGEGGLPASERDGIAGRLEALTGIAASQWLENGLRIDNRTFLRTLLADEGLEAGNYDSRYTLPLAQSGNDPVADDPAMGRYVPGFVASFHELMGRHLGVSMPFPYSAITWVDLNFRWKWERLGVPVGRTYGDELAVAMRRNPNMRVLAASGYYDMVTTAAAAESQIRRAGLPADRVTIRNYESGHMLYLGDTAERFAGDVRGLIAGRP
jgi:carboxypeptidase C (cathepsin A)